jgi:outer membrane lipoprotein-sorting protein
LITLKLDLQYQALVDGENFIFYNSSFKQVNNIVSVISIEQTNTFDFLIELSATEVLNKYNATKSRYGY